jgi:hypothetical protein
MDQIAEEQEGPAVADQVEGDGDGAALLVAVAHDGHRLVASLTSLTSRLIVRP